MKFSRQLFVRCAKRAIVVAAIALVEFSILQFLLYLGAGPAGGVDCALSVLLTAAAYIVISAVFVLFKKYRIAMWIAIHAFIYDCIFVTYANKLIDVLAFAVVLTDLLFSMIALNDKIRTQQEKKEQ